MKIAGAVIAVIALAGSPNEARNDSSKANNEGNKALGQNLFTTGQPVGGVTLIVPNPAGG